MFELSVVFQVNRDAGRSPCVTSVQTLVWHGSRTAPRGCRAVFSSHVQNRHANPHGLRFLDRPKPSLAAGRWRCHTSTGAVPRGILMDYGDEGRPENQRRVPHPPSGAGSGFSCQVAVASTTINAGSIASSSLTSLADPAGELATFNTLWMGWTKTSSVSRKHRFQPSAGTPYVDSRLRVRSKPTRACMIRASEPQAIGRTRKRTSCPRSQEYARLVPS